MSNTPRKSRLVCVLAIVCALLLLAVTLCQAQQGQDTNAAAQPASATVSPPETGGIKAEHTSIPAAKADRPFAAMDDNKHGDGSVPFRDQKGKARLETCIGACLKKYPEILKFIMSESTKFSGLQVMFLSDKPVLKFYNDAEELTEQIDDIATKTSLEIEKILIDHGLEKF